MKFTSRINIDLVPVCALCFLVKNAFKIATIAPFFAKSHTCPMFYTQNIEYLALTLDKSPCSD